MESKEKKHAKNDLYNLEELDPDMKKELSANKNPGTEQVTTAALFMKVGIMVLSLIAIIGFGVNVLPNAVTVSNTTITKSEMPIYSVQTDEKKVALTFDCAYENDDTQKILDTLDKYQLKATFFVTGDWVEKYPNSVKKIVAAGHDIGNHSDNHKKMTKLTKEECTKEIMEVHDDVMELTGIEMSLFRAPYGDYDKAVLDSAKDCGYHTIQWDIDSQDWKDHGVDSILNRVVGNKKLSNGSIILMHNGAKYTPGALELIIVGLQDQGYKIVPVSKLIYTGEYTVDKTGRQFGE